MASSKLSLTFRIFKGDQLIREERLAQGVIKVGKVPSAHLRIDDESVSRMHAIVEVTGADVHIIDLGSTRGTFVNGQKINKAKLSSGDSIQLGDSRVELAIAEPVPEAAAVPAARPAPVVVAGTLPVAPAALPPLPVPPPLPMRQPMPAPVAMAMAEPADELGGAKAVEVAAMLGDSVVGVKHCMDPRGGKVTRATWAFAAGGLACLLASAAAFYVSIDTAASNKAALEYHTRVQQRPAYAFRPREVGGLTGGVAFGGLAVGLGLATLALVRARGERRSPFYRIGTAPGVEQPLEGAPSASYALVAPSGDDFVLNYGPGIEGELIADGRSTPLAELAATGRMRPSITTPGAIEIPIPAAARIRARAGQTTFLVSAVARPKAQATAALAAVLEGRTLKYVAGSLATHLALVLLLSQVDIPDAGANVELSNREPPSILSRLNASETAPPEQKEPEQDSGGTEGESLQTTGMQLPEGGAGDPKQQKENGQLQIKKTDDTQKLAREEALERARNAGILGSYALRDSMHGMTSDDFSSGFDTENQWGPLDGAPGAGRGTFGMGVNGTNRGGNCFAPPCGIIGTGPRYTGTIGTGKFAGDGYWAGKGGNGELRKHIAMAPIFSPPTIHNSGIDKAIIKRYIKQREAQISYCYEKELLARPGIAGEVMINFLISPRGDVQSSAGRGFDGKVAGCVANVIQNIAFPMSRDGAPVQVSYPFIFRPAGS